MNTLCVVSRMNKYYKELVSNTYEDIDESILACMAAGVPLSEITLTTVKYLAI